MKYLIIGLGHYGATLAMELTAMGHEVVGADGNGLHVDSVKDRMAASFALDATDEMALSVLPLKSVDAVIVAIGDNFGASVRIVSLLKKLKVKRIYARAVDEVHKGVLEAFSIDRILTPEQDAARLLAHQSVAFLKCIVLWECIGHLFLEDRYTQEVFHLFALYQRNQFQTEFLFQVQFIDVIAYQFLRNL